MRKNCLKYYIIYISIILLPGCRDNNESFIERLQPIPRESGFKMDGYWIWGGSVIKVGDTYHIFASRWPKKNKFPDDYFEESEIVSATSNSPMGPYTFREVVIGERDSSFWDSNMAHNPTIHKVGNEYVLFYIGSDFTSFREQSDRLLRRIGYATTTNIEGPWKRSDKAVINEESNNPALLIESGGEVKLMFRDEVLKIKLAIAANFKGPYQIVNDNVWGVARLEDFYIYKNNGKYHLICEDNEGVATGHVRWGAHFFSDDGISNWQKYTPAVVYDHNILMDSGETMHCTRRERPQLFIEKDRITHLFNGVYDGENSWCQPVELSPPIQLK